MVDTFAFSGSGLLSSIRIPKRIIDEDSTEVLRPESRGNAALSSVAEATMGKCGKDLCWLGGQPSWAMMFSLLFLDLNKQPWREGPERILVETSWQA